MVLDSSAALAASLSAKVCSLAAAWGLGLELMGEAAPTAQDEARRHTGNPAGCRPKGFSALSHFQTHGQRKSEDGLKQAGCL